MFWYVFDIDNLKRGPGPWSFEDGISIIENRREALMYIKILGAKCRVVLKGQP